MQQASYVLYTTLFGYICKDLLGTDMNTKTILTFPNRVVPGTLPGTNHRMFFLTDCVRLVFFAGVEHSYVRIEIRTRVLVSRELYSK